MNVSELIDLLSLCRPDAEVQATDEDSSYNIKEFLTIKDTMVWSGAPILCIGKK